LRIIYPSVNKLHIQSNDGGNAKED